MDQIRQELDELMGKDRDLPLQERLKKQEHFDDQDVCKYILVSFCPHDLFPNTKADLGRCRKRHDEKYKAMFENDPYKEHYQRKYEKQLIELLEGLISQVDARIRKSMSRIEAPLPDKDATEDEIRKAQLLTKKIAFYMEKAEKLGAEGKLDEAEQITRQVEVMKHEKLDTALLSDNPLLQKERLMKVCEICGAMQSNSDTEKRLTTHLEGKLHTGYATIRKILQDLRARREFYKRKDQENGPPPVPPSKVSKEEIEKLTRNDRFDRPDRRPPRRNDRPRYDNYRGGGGGGGGMDRNREFRRGGHGGGDYHQNYDSRYGGGGGRNQRDMGYQQRDNRRMSIDKERDYEHRGHRGYEGGNRGYEGGNRGYDGGNRGYEGGNRGYDGGNRGYDGGNRGGPGGGGAYYGGGGGGYGRREQGERRPQHF